MLATIEAVLKTHKISDRRLLDEDVQVRNAIEARHPNPCNSAYLAIVSAWFSVEYFWCSVDMRTYCAARTGCTVLRFPTSPTMGVPVLHPPGQDDRLLGR
jgi:hypothetical protein